MDDRQVSADLLRLGFSVEKRNALWFVGFPDGEDGCVFDVQEMAALDVAQLAELANLRRQAIDGIRALLAHAGWGMQLRGDDGVVLRCPGMLSYLDLGLPLTFWLRRAGLQPTLRRFVDGFVRDLDERAFERVRRVDATAQSHEIYEKSLAIWEAIDANAIELEVDPQETVKLLAEIEAYQREAEREHRAWVDAQRIDGSVAVRLRDVLARSRNDIRGGNGLWLGSLPLWMSDADDWVTTDEWIEWAIPLFDRWVGHAAHVLLRFAPARFAPIVREKLLDGIRDQTLEMDEGDLELAIHCADDDEFADWVFAQHPLRNLRSAAAAVGRRDALYGPSQKASALLRRQPTDLLPWLSDLADVQKTVGWRFFGSILTAAQRAQIAAACHSALDTPVEPLMAATTAETVVMLALGIQDADIARRIATEPFWQSALLSRWNGCRFLTLEDSILAISLLMPGDDCRQLIERATEHLDGAYDSYGVDSTALALAIAWRRCEQATPA